MGDTKSPERTNTAALLASMDAIVGNAVARARTSAEEMPVLVVGGGSVLLGETIDGLRVIRLPHHDLANAVGVAIAQVSGEMSKIVTLDDALTRDDAIARVTAEANAAAIADGADPDSLHVLAVSDVPLAYLPGNNLAIRVTVVGDLKHELTS